MLTVQIMKKVPAGLVLTDCGQGTISNCHSNGIPLFDAERVEGLDVVNSSAVNTYQAGRMKDVKRSSIRSFVGWTPSKRSRGRKGGGQ